MLSQLITDKCLLIFDPHENVEWVRGVIEKESDRVSHLLLGGDYFDSGLTPKQSQGGVRQMCELLNEICDTWGENLTILWGNHDIAYYEARPWVKRHQKPRNRRYGCSGFTVSKAAKIHKLLTDSFWEMGRLFQMVNGYLVSHAGVHPNFWKGESIEGGLTRLEVSCEQALSDIGRLSHAILEPGIARGGQQAFGGITWLDFECEFEDALLVPQIVGHTGSDAGPRQKGKSWCLDGNGSCYGILSNDGFLEIKTL